MAGTAATGSADASQSGPATSTKPRTKSTQPAATKGTTSKSGATVAAPARTYHYRITAKQSDFAQPFEYDVDATVADAPDGGFNVRWTDTHDTGEGGGRPPETRPVHKIADGWGGEFFLGDAAHWGIDDYQPPPLLAPATYQQGRSWPVDSVFDGDEMGQDVHDHLTGTVTLTGQKAVAIAGKPCTVWVIHDQWRSERTKPGPSVVTGSGDLWWCPELRVFVKAVTDFNANDIYGKAFQDHHETVMNGLTE